MKTVKCANEVTLKNNNPFYVDDEPTRTFPANTEFLVFDEFTIDGIKHYHLIYNLYGDDEYQGYVAVSDIQ